MSPALIQLIALAGPQVFAVAVELIKEVSDKSPEAVTSEQWAALRALVAEDYDARRARIAAQLKLGVG